MKKKTNLAFQAVLFDLGKVLVHFNFDPAFRRLSKECGCDAKEIEDYFVESGLEAPYDSGQISSLQFYTQIRRGLALKCDYRGFRKTWNEIFKVNRAVTNLLPKLKRKGCRLVLISNTNALHWEYIRKKYVFLKWFDRLIISYRERMRKPDERIYRLAARHCRAKPERILYVDDREDLIRAAGAIGFKTFLYKNNTRELIKFLEAHRLL